MATIFSSAEEIFYLTSGSWTEKNPQIFLNFVKKTASEKSTRQNCKIEIINWVGVAAAAAVAAAATAVAACSKQKKVLFSTEQNDNY